MKDVKRFSLISMIFLVALRVGPTQSTNAASRPNVLFIAVDDLNDWIGCLAGHPQTVTPNMDRLAKRGVLFTNAHCAAPACNPSRAAIFSGRNPNQTGVYSNNSPRIRSAQPDLVLLPQHFQKAGYRTLGTGKLLHSKPKGVFQEEFFPEQRWSPFSRDQVEYSAEELPSKGSDHPRHVVKNGPGGRRYVLPLNRMPSDRNPQNPKGESFDWGPLPVADTAMGDGQITDWAIKQLKQKDAVGPFFLAVGYYRPHIPLYAPQRYFDLLPPTDEIELPAVLRNDLDDLSPSARKWALEAVTAGAHSTVLRFRQWQAAVRAYLACIAFVDAQIGRLLDGLDTSAHAENTIVVLWGDHGWHLGEKQHWGKWTGWQRSTRVPLIVVPAKRNGQPGYASGGRCRQPVSLVDLYPTLIELCELPKKADLVGESLVGLLAKPDQATDRLAVTFFDPGNVSLTGTRWHYIRYQDGSEELYHVGDDPHEWHNLAGSPSHQEVVKQFRRRLPPQ